MSNFKLSGSPMRGLAGTTLGFFFGSAAVSLFGPSAIHFKEAMSLDPAMIGLLVAIPSLSGSLLRIPFGAWVDTTGGKKPFVILLILSVIGLSGITWLLSARYPDRMEGFYPLVLLFGFLSGCGIATFSVGIGQTSYWYPQKKQGMALGAFGGIGTLAPGIFALLLPVYLSQFGFISAYVAWSLFLISGTILYIFLGKNAYYFQYLKSGMSADDSRIAAQKAGQELFPGGSVKQSLIDSIKIPATWVLIFLYFATFGGFLALTEWYPSYWNQFYGFHPVKAGILTALFSILSALVRVFGGSISDKIGGERLCVFSMVLLALSGLGMMFSTHYGFSIFFTILVAIAMGFNNSAVFKLLPSYIPKAIGGASGWVGGLGAFGGFILPPVMGWLVTVFGKIGYVRGFGIFALLAVVNLLILYFGLMKHRAKSNLSTR